MGPDLYSDSQEVIATQTLLMVRELITCEIRHWNDILRDRVDVFATLGVNGFSDGHRGAAAWAVLRLGKLFRLTLCSHGHAKLCYKIG